MRFCQTHWTELREAIEERGLGDLIAPDGEVAMEQIVDQLKRAERGEDPGTPVNYDPLMAAHWAIVNNLTEAARATAGPAAALHVAMGDHCPVCFANEQHELSCDDPDCAFTYDAWIGYAADDQLAHVKTLRGES